MEDGKKIISGIYQWRNLVNGKVYVGSAFELVKRKNTHLSKLRLNKHPNKKLQSSYNKHGQINFVFEILELVMPDKNTLIEREQYYIDLHDPWYNIRKVASSNKGTKISEQGRINIRNAIIGRKHSEETKKKLSLGKIGNKHGAGNKNNLGRKQSKEEIEKRALKLRGQKRVFSEEWKKNISQGSLGKKLSDSHRKNISRSLIGNKRAANNYHLTKN